MPASGSTAPHQAGQREGDARRRRPALRRTFIGGDGEGTLAKRHSFAWDQKTGEYIDKAFTFEGQSEHNQRTEQLANTIRLLREPLVPEQRVGEISGGQCLDINPAARFLDHVIATWDGQLHRRDRPAHVTAPRVPDNPVRGWGA